MLPVWAWVSTVFAVCVACFLYYLENKPIENERLSCRMAEAAPDNTEAFKAQGKSAFVVGYTGLTGNELAKELLKSQLFSRVILIGRREVKYEDEILKNAEQKVVDFDKLEEFAGEFQGIDVGYCCLGTTRGKAGKEGFIKVDRDYVLKTAELAKAGGCSHFHLMSSQGTNKDSSFLYPKIKGQVEEAVSNMGFDRVSIYRPGVLMGNRQETRFGEGVARFFLKPVAALFPTIMTTPITTVVKAMINNTVAASDEKVELFENKAVHILAGEYKCKEDKSK